MRSEGNNCDARNVKKKIKKLEQLLQNGKLDIIRRTEIK